MTLFLYFGVSVLLYQRPKTSTYLCCSPVQNILDSISLRLPSVYNFNKKVLLRERKRHTVRHIVLALLICLLTWGSTPSSLGRRVPHSVLDRGYPIQSWLGVPHPVLDGGTPSSYGGYPIQSWTGGYPIQSSGSPILNLDGVPLGQQDGVSSHPDLGWGTPTTSAGWSNPPLSRPGIWYPHPDLRQDTHIAPPPPPKWWTKWKHYLPSSFGSGR